MAPAEIQAIGTARSLGSIGDCGEVSATLVIDSLWKPFSELDARGTLATFMLQQSSNRILKAPNQSLVVLENTGPISSMSPF
jgi:hypothetical protein